MEDSRDGGAECPSGETGAPRVLRVPDIEEADVLRRVPAALVPLPLLLAISGLLGAGVVPSWPGAIHLVALPPLDVIADLRWLLTTSRSWPAFLAVWGLLLLCRVTVLAALLGSPARPAWRPAVGTYVVAMPVALVAAQFDFIAHAVLYSRIYGAALGVAALLFLVVAPLPWTPASTLRAALRHAARHGFRAEVTVPYAAALLLLGAVVEQGGSAWVLPAVPVSAGLTALAAWRLRAAPLLPATLVWAGLIGVLTAAALGTVLSRGPDPTPDPAARDGSLLLMSGINSSSGEGTIFTLDPDLLGYTCEQTHYFSYAGTGDGQPQGVATCPIRTGAPYVPEDTQRPFAEQVELLEAQTAQLQPPLVVLAHSQAAWVAWAAASSGRLEPGTSLVLIGPFPSSPVAYPPEDTDGPGRVGGDLLRVLEPVPQLADFDFVVDAPLSRELLAQPDAATRVFEAPLPEGIDALAATASSDLALLPDGWRLEGARDVCPLRTAHPYLPVDATLLSEIDAFLDRRPATRCPPWPDLYRSLVQAVGVPPVRS
jgi:hypothetical protein